VGYVGFLSVHSEHRGRGIGKALLFETIAVATHSGFPISGSSSGPGTKVHLENCLPMVLCLPRGADFLGGVQ